MLLENEMDLLPAFCTQNSSSSDISAPVTPTFSTRHCRYSSSASSMDASLTIAPVLDNSPASPTFIGLKSGKRSLPDVQEEPQERDEDFEMLDADELYDCFCKL
jgi:hypothetical protein